MVSIKFQKHDGNCIETEVEAGGSLMMAARAENVDGIVGECGGSAMCATCHVYVGEAYVRMLPPMSDVEDEMLECTAADRRPNSRLSCQIQLDASLNGMLVEIPEKQI